MSLKSIALTAVVASATTFGIASASPAQAAIVGDGGLNLRGTTTITDAGQSNPTLNFSGFSLNAKNGSFSGLSGDPVIKSLLLTDNNPTGGTDAKISTGAKANFITGLILNGKPFAFDLNATGLNLSGDIRSETDFTVVGPIFGRFRSENAVLGEGYLASLSFSSVGSGLSSISLTTAAVPTAVPTPALLPGLVGMGVAALRKRKSEDSEEILES